MCLNEPPTLGGWGATVLLAEATTTPLAIPIWMGVAVFGGFLTTLGVLIGRVMKGYDDQHAEHKRAIETETSQRRERDHELANDIQNVRLDLTAIQAEARARTPPRDRK